MIHSGHAAMVHAGHTAHVSHGQARRFAQLRHGRFHTLFRGQCCPGIARTSHGFGKNGVRLLILRAHNHVVGFGHTNPEFVHVNRLNVVAIGLDHGHIKTGDSDIEIGHRGRVDKTQPDTLPRLKESGPVLVRPLTVDQARKALHILNVRFHHAHIAPGHAVPNGVHQTVFGRVRKKLPHGLLLTVVVIRHHLQVPHDAVAGVRVFVGQLNHVFAIVPERLTPLGFDNDGSVSAVRLLETRVAVKPISARLLDREFVGKGFPWLDARETDAGHAVLVEREN